MAGNYKNNLDIYISAKNSGQRIAPMSADQCKSPQVNQKSTIKINKSHNRQKILGFGGSFTEASASVYAGLDNRKKEEIINAYFGSSGNNYSMARTHINSCDFSLENYAHCETDGDIELETFSISRNKKMLLPFIKDALNTAKNKVRIMAAPWSPPSWMKTNGQMNFGGKLKDEYKESWANYYCKFIEHYEDEKIPIWGVSVQNEPEAKQTWDSCLYTAEEERDFIKSFLGPALESRGMSDKKLIIWDHNRDLMVERARTVFKDPVAAKYVWGTGFHWYNGDHFDNVQKVHDEFPDKELIFTEGCQEGGPHIGSWDLGERYATSIINDLNRWTVAWIDWNLILDELGGPNHVGNFCSAPIIVDTKSQEILYQSSYYYMGHFSRFLKPGDQIVDSDSTNNNLLVLSSISTSKNSIQTVVLNKQSSPEYFRYMRDDTMFGFSIPERSIITIVDRLKF